MSLTIVMYHYVRDLRRSRYPAIRGRTIDAFRGQLDHFSRHYEVITVDQVGAAVRGEASLPDNACWLTFDDGYIDHFQSVFPLLEDRGWQGSFFAPAKPILEGRVLDVNKIHFILASEPDAMNVVEHMRREVEHAREDGASLRSWEDYLAEYRTQCHLDTPDVLFVKLMLQKGLPEAVRGRICDSLFSRFVSADESSFAGELYLSVDQARTMVRAGMAFGSHGYSHRWLASLDSDGQELEIQRSIDFLCRLGMPRERWAICYPYGNYDETTLEIARRLGAELGVTTREAIADLSRHGALELPRVDTISLPIS